MIARINDHKHLFITPNPTNVSALKNTYNPYVHAIISMRIHGGLDGGLVFTIH